MANIASGCSVFGHLGLPQSEITRSEVRRRGEIARLLNAQLEFQADPVIRPLGDYDAPFTGQLMARLLHFLAESLPLAEKRPALTLDLRGGAAASWCAVG